MMAELERGKKLFAQGEKDYADALIDNTEEQLAKLQQLWLTVDTWADVMFDALASEFAQGMTCREADMTVALFKELGRENDADLIAKAHALGDDDPTDAHYDPKMWVDYDDRGRRSRARRHGGG